MNIPLIFAYSCCFLIGLGHLNNCVVLRSETEILDLKFFISYGIYEMTYAFYIHKPLPKLKTIQGFLKCYIEFHYRFNCRRYVNVQALHTTS